MTMIPTGTIVSAATIICVITGALIHKRIKIHRLEEEVKKVQMKAETKALKDAQYEARKQKLEQAQNLVRKASLGELRDQAGLFQRIQQSEDLGLTNDLSLIAEEAEIMAEGGDWKSWPGSVVGHGEGRARDC